MNHKVLIIGAGGQIGSELTYKLRELYGHENVIASDINTNNKTLVNSGIFEVIDARDALAIKACVKRHNINTVYLMAAMLSASAEKSPNLAWDLNMTSLFNVLDLAKEKHIKQLFWPSSIAVFGPETPQIKTPQKTIKNPTTVYGISKLAGERWCEYYYKKYNVDVRSLRYPGIISWKTLPGGGTTDYAVEIYHDALLKANYDSFLQEDSYLPMMFIDDSIKATIGIMQAKPDAIKVRSSYNLSAISFSPKEVAESIKKYIPEFSITYNPDFRQAIADSWPKSIDDSEARKDWNWNHSYALDDITNEMLNQLRKNYQNKELKHI